jgi:hypothetical protein
MSAGMSQVLKFAPPQDNTLDSFGPSLHVFVADRGRAIICLIVGPKQRARTSLAWPGNGQLRD